ncbi:MAG TPA: rRNA maturation RNase YbeY [Rhizomicrobium sp.]|jgi:probable rRNA maturation factor|nr:rRNA maturation RNase YbeY [Rhizomicrobium sp.]
MTARNGVTLVVEEPAWRSSGVALARIGTAARLAVARGRAQHDAACALTILLTHDGRLRELNARFRGKDAATNVLSFPAAGNVEGYLGDVAIALGVTRRESATAGVTLEAHTLHLGVHGVLHLLGYDHVLAREARAMERLEIAVLHELGLPSPSARAAAE